MAAAGQLFSFGNTGGRPRVYDTPEQFAEQILDYFQNCEGEYKEEEYPLTDKNNEPTGKMGKRTVCIRQPEKITITGMCLHVGFESRSTFDKQAERSEEFSYIVKRAKLVVENRYEHGLDGNNPTGPIFALKNMGWKDKQEHEHSGDMGITWLETKTYAPKPEADPGA